MTRVFKRMILQKKENIMVAKKKGLYLGLLLSMLGISGTIQAYKVIIKNDTPHSISYKVDIELGKDKHGTIDPGRTANVNISSLWDVRNITATVFEKIPDSRFPRGYRIKKVKATGYQRYEHAPHSIGPREWRVYKATKNGHSYYKIWIDIK